MDRTYNAIIKLREREREHLHHNFNINSHFLDLSLGLARAPARWIEQISGIQHQEVAKTF